MRYGKMGGNHQTWSWPADKMIPKGAIKRCRMYAGPLSSDFEYNATTRKIVKKIHKKRCRAWAKRQAEDRL